MKDWWGMALKSMINNVRLGIGIVIAVAVNMTLVSVILLVSLVTYPLTLIAWLIAPSDIRTSKMWPLDYIRIVADTLYF